MNRILVTAIGSMSAPIILEELQKIENIDVVGTDIYPKEWQVNLPLVSKFYQVEKSTSSIYIEQILDICRQNNINYIFPLTDPEVDVLSGNRVILEEANIVLCISSLKTINKCRDKSVLESLFKGYEYINVIPSFSYCDIQNEFVYPIIAKPKKGRSSEGLFRLERKTSLSVICNVDDYIFQPYIKGSVYTVDFIRDINGNCCSVARKELIRTSNGAGLVVEVIRDEYLEKATGVIGEALNIQGCINIEFLFDGEKFYLMDINPRFSAGVGFSVKSGYNFVTNHYACFQNKNIEKLTTLNTSILKRNSFII